MRESWNHNIEYHRIVLAAVPRPCANALDVGCGTGMFSRKLARYAERVVGIDVDFEALAVAQKAAALPNVSFALKDVMTDFSQPGSFDFICSVAVLHHLPLQPALRRFAELLAPGGTLAVVGLYRPEGLGDRAYDALGFFVSQAKRRLYNFEEMKAPTKEPQQTLREVKIAAERLLPGSSLKRHLLFRYSLIWRKPA